MSTARRLPVAEGIGKMARRLSLVLALAATAGAASDRAHGAETMKRLATNRLATNRLATNPLSPNPPATNPLSPTPPEASPATAPAPSTADGPDGYNYNI